MWNWTSHNVLHGFEAFSVLLRAAVDSKGAGLALGPFLIIGPIPALPCCCKCNAMSPSLRRFIACFLRVFLLLRAAVDIEGREPGSGPILEHVHAAAIALLCLATSVYMFL